MFNGAFFHYLLGDTFQIPQDLQERAFSAPQKFNTTPPSEQTSRAPAAKRFFAHAVHGTFQIFFSVGRELELQAVRRGA